MGGSIMQNILHVSPLCAVFENCPAPPEFRDSPCKQFLKIVQLPLNSEESVHYEYAYEKNHELIFY